MIRKLAILGATGDLTARYLLPGLAALRAAGEVTGRPEYGQLPNHVLNLPALGPV